MAAAGEEEVLSEPSGKEEEEEAGAEADAKVPPDFLASLSTRPSST